MDEITIEGKLYKGYTIPTTRASMLIICAEQGLLACGYVNVETADKIGDAVAIVRGVNSYADMLSKGVSSVSKTAADMGVEIGMTGKEALKIMND